MQLFQPTNITPDIRGAFGNGVQDASSISGLDITWQVNGNAPMTAFQIDIYKNDTESTLLYSTGRITDNCPFYGMGPDGAPNLFHHYITPTICIQNGITPGNTNGEYKLKITQWWSETDFVAQQSPSVFLFLYYPYFSITGVPATVTDRTVTVTATASRFIGSFGQYGFLWIRWVLEDQSGTEWFTVKDTGKIYGSPELSFSYDGLLNGETYRLTLTGETELGETIGQSRAVFSVSYDVESTGIGMEASRACDGESAVLVNWSRLVYIPAITVGSVGYGKRNVVFPSGSYLYWMLENMSTMSIEPEWAVVWKGTLNGENDNLVTLTFDDGTTAELEFVYVDGGPGGWLIFGYNGYAIGNRFFDVRDGAQATVVLTKDYIYVRANGYDGLFPSDELYPGTVLYPTDGKHGYVIQNCHVLSETPFAERTIKRVQADGPQTLEYLLILDHTPTTQEIQSRYFNDEWTPTFDAGTRFLFTKDSPLGSAGSINSQPSSFTGARLYRETVASGTLEKVADLAISVRSVLDYGALSQGGPFRYYLFLDHQSGSAVNQSRAVSNEVSPCFWNWTVLSCEEQADGSYQVVSSYLFGKNVSSGTVSNNNRPNVLNNFTPYPMVQLSPSNYKSGTLQSLIGVIDYAEGQNAYTDTPNLRDAILNLSVSTNTLFLKNRKGDLWKIRPAGEIAMETMDNTREQAQSMSFPWVEIGSTKGVAIYQIVS